MNNANWLLMRDLVLIEYKTDWIEELIMLFASS